MLEEAIKFAALEWPMNGGIIGIITLGYDQVKSYTEFIERLIDRFDGKDPKLNFKELAQLRKIGSIDHYITEFQKLSIMVMDISERKQIVLFMDGLTEPLRDWVKSFNPATLLEAIKKARSMPSSSTSSS